MAVTYMNIYNCRSLLQNMVSFIELFCKGDLYIHIYNCKWLIRLCMLVTSLEASLRMSPRLMNYIYIYIYIYTYGSLASWRIVLMAHSPHGPSGAPSLVGSFKLQVSVAKEPYKRDDILQKRPIILRSLLMNVPRLSHMAHSPHGSRASA